MAFPVPPLPLGPMPSRPSGLPFSPADAPYSALSSRPPSTPYKPDPSFPSVPRGARPSTEPSIITWTTVTLRPHDKSVPDDLVSACFCPRAPTFLRSFADRKDIANSSEMCQALSLPAWNAWMQNSTARELYGPITTAAEIMKVWSLGGFQATDERLLKRRDRTSVSLAILSRGAFEVPNIWLACDRQPCPGTDVWLLLKRVKFTPNAQLASDLGITPNDLTSFPVGAIVDSDDEDELDSKMPPAYTWQWVPHVTFARCTPSLGEYNDFAGNPDDEYAGHAVQLGTVVSSAIPAKQHPRFKAAKLAALRACNPAVFSAEIVDNYSDLPKLKLQVKM